MMAWLPTFPIRILDDRVNNNIMHIVVPIDMYGRFPIWLLQARKRICYLNNRESTYTYGCTCMNGHVTCVFVCVV